MGTDIHIVIQRRGDSGWEEIVWRGRPGTADGIPVCPRGFDDRNYDLFAIIGGVRNGRGFAGVKTGSGWPTIASCRGLPDDFTEDTVAAHPDYPEEGPRNLGDHSQTWVTLDELRAFPWDDVRATLCGVISADEYAERVCAGETRAPAQWSGGISGPGIAVYDEAAWKNLLSGETIATKPYVRVQWMETAREATGDWAGTALPWLEEIAGGKQLRLVIGFDS
jgi:hypothetical protein